MGTLGVWLKDLISRDRRIAKRKDSLSLVAYFWDGAAPVAHPVRDASTAGFYLLTEHRWYPGTMIRMVLQEKNISDSETARSIEVVAKVVRTGKEGVGFAFVAPHRDHSDSSKTVDPKTLGKFLQGLKENKDRVIMAPPSKLFCSCN